MNAGHDSFCANTNHMQKYRQLIPDLPLCPFLTLVGLVVDDLSIAFFSPPAPTSSPAPPDPLLGARELLRIGGGGGAGGLGLALGLPAPAACLPASSVPGKDMRDKAEAARDVGARRVRAISWSVRLLARTTTVWGEGGGTRQPNSFLSVRDGVGFT